MCEGEYQVRWKDDFGPQSHFFSFAVAYVLLLTTTALIVPNLLFCKTLSVLVNKINFEMEVKIKMGKYALFLSTRWWCYDY